MSIFLNAGVDEAGRGPLVGSVFAAAVILPAQYDLPGFIDTGVEKNAHGGFPFLIAER